MVITVTKMSTPATAKEKTNKKNDVKARATKKKTQKENSLEATVMKNFSATSAKSLESIFNRLQKIVSRLAILGSKFHEDDWKHGYEVTALFASVYTVISWDTLPGGCRAPRRQGGQLKNQDNPWEARETMKSTSSKARWLLMCKVLIGVDMANEVLFSEEVAVLKREVGCKNYETNVLKSELEKVKQEKDGIDFKIEKFDKASKDLDQLPNKLDLSYSGLDEFKEPEFKGYGPENSKQESNVVCEKESDNSKENSDESLVEEQVSQDKSSFVESSPNVDKETVFPANKKVEFTKPENHEKPVKKSVRPRIVNTARSYRTPVNTVRPRVVNTARPNRTSVNVARANGFNAVKPSAYPSYGCSRHMTSNIDYLSDFKQFDGSYVAFGGGTYGGKISGKGTLKTDNLDFEDVYFVNELKFNLFSVSQMCDKKNYVLYIDTECLVLC
ncbi:hypothetical protein Tco_0806721 [Tanacetum coccineum]